MFYLHPTEKWIEDVVQRINERQLKPEQSRFMIAFFSSLDNEFVEYFKINKDRISSYSGQNFHIFTPLIYDGNVIPDDEWRYMRNEFKNMGIPIGSACNSFHNFPNKLKAVIDGCIEAKDSYELPLKLSEIFQTKSILRDGQIDYQFTQTISNKLPKSKLFISHSSVDKPFVRRLEAELSKDSSLKFWIDENEILAGDDIQNSITKSLSDSDYLLLIISDYSTKSNWVNFEVSQFMGFAEGKNIIPIVISKGYKFSEPIDNLVRRLKYLDFTDESNWGANIAAIKRVLIGEGINFQVQNKTVNFNSTVESAIVGDNNKITIKQTTKTVKEKYPPGCIGYDTIKANYIAHLINRYNEYKEYEVGKGQIKYAVFAVHLKKHFKIAPTRTLYNLHIDKFWELVTYIHSRIDGTKLAKVKGQAHKNYSTYDEFATGQK